MEKDLIETLQIVVAGFVGGFAGIVINIYKETGKNI